MNNKYYLLRHGESFSNTKKIICSSLKNGLLTRYSLTKTGILQVQETSKNLLFYLRTQTLNLKEDTLIISSPFVRTMQTARIIQSNFHIGDNIIKEDHRLCERNFSKYELTSSNNYQTVWDADTIREVIEGVESPNAVLERLTSFFEEYEAKYTGKYIVIISHGDTLSIARSFFDKSDPFLHREKGAIKNAECIHYD